MIEHGVVTNRGDMEKVWHQTFYVKFHVAPKKHKALLIKTSINPKSSVHEFRALLQNVKVAREMLDTRKIRGSIRRKS